MRVMDFMMRIFVDIMPAQDRKAHDKVSESLQVIERYGDGYEEDNRAHSIFYSIYAGYPADKCASGFCQTC